MPHRFLLWIRCLIDALIIAVAAADALVLLHVIIVDLIDVSLLHLLSHVVIIRHLGL